MVEALCCLPRSPLVCPVPRSSAVPFTGMSRRRIRIMFSTEECLVEKEVAMLSTKKNAPVN